MKTQNKGFTLVELIVVITILAILGSIAFIGIQGYTKSARDSSRIADVGQFRSGIEIFQVEAGMYPMPDNVDNSILVQSNPVNYPGTTGELSSSIARLSDSIYDPATFEEYDYAIEGNKKSYQIVYHLEDDGNAGILNEAHAADFVETVVVGNYNGVFARSEAGDIATMPSLVTKTSTTGNITAGTEVSFKIPGETTSTVAFTPSEITYSTTEELITNLQTEYAGVGVSEEIKSLEKITEISTLTASDSADQETFESGYLGQTTTTSGGGSTPNNCTAGSIVGTNATYSYSEIADSATGTGSGAKTISNGSTAYTANLSCLDGTVTIDSEISGTTTCDSGYAVYSGACVASGDFVQISAGNNHTCGITASGGAKCWGLNNYGQIGKGDTTGEYGTPQQVTGLTSGVLKISSGSYHTCVIVTGGQVKCWGYNGYGQIGNSIIGSNALTPQDVTFGGYLFSEITAGGLHTCGVTLSGAALCWGYNGDGELGKGSTGGNYSTPIQATGLTSGVIKIAAGGNHTCALTDIGGVKCWGFNNFGQLGINSSTGSYGTPQDVTNLGSGVVEITAGQYHSCITDTSGAAKCWGRNEYGQVGEGSTGGVFTTATLVSGLSSGTSKIYAGHSHTCAVNTGGGAKCWGRNMSGALGIGNTDGSNYLVPQDVQGLSTGVSSITIGFSYSCAITSSGAKCWGRNTNGVLGIGNTDGLGYGSPQNVVY